MRKRAINKNYKNVPVPGILNIKEKRNFLCSVLMDINDEIRVTYNYTKENISNTPLPLDVLSLYNYDSLKEESHIIKINESQSTTDLNNNTQWIIELDSKTLLRDYLYNEIFVLNPDSVFNNIPQNIVPNDKVSNLVYEYIDNNILDKYQVKEFILWTDFYNLNFNTVPGTGTSNENPTINLLEKTPVFSFNAIPTSDADENKKSTSIKQFENGKYEINYRQNKSSKFETFIYYFDVIFERI